MFLNNLSNYYVPLALAVAMGLFGAWLLRQPRGGDEPDESRGGRRAGGCLMVALGLLVSGSLVFSPPPWERSRYVKAILNAQPDDVEQIVIIPEPHPEGAYSGLFESEVIVGDRESIRAICTALSSAENDFGGNYQKIWHCKLRLALSSGTYECRVSKDWKNQSFVQFESDRGFFGLGANFGDLRCDKLGTVLEWIPRPPANPKTRRSLNR